MTGHYRAQIALLPDGRLHLNDGPIDLAIEAVGERCAVADAYSAAASRFIEVLDELCTELPTLRSDAGRGMIPKGRIAQRMFAAVQSFANSVFITPMAAVAGSVAEEILGIMTDAAELRRASVNNGGDIAIHLSHGESYRVGIVVDIPRRLTEFDLAGLFRIHSKDPTRGIATSGWQGRSFSLGIADAVTVLARTASMADAAATVIANAVDLPGHPAVVRMPAREVAPDSDLGGRMVTRGVSELTSREIATALDRGRIAAEECLVRGLIDAAALWLQGELLLVRDTRADVRIPGAEYEVNVA
jgi:ApbE superfamily uncharacterized protein (UPF0280 family)